MAILSAVLFLAFAQEPAVKVSWDHVVKKTKWSEATITSPKFSGAGQLGTLAAKSIKSASQKDMEVFLKDFQPDEKPTMNYAFEAKSTVSIANPRLISTYTSLYEFTGGAHPNHNYRALNFAMVGGKARAIKFSDLMRTKMAPKAVVSGVVIPRLKQMGASMAVNEEMTEVPAEIVDRFVVTPAGLTWIFAPYEAGAYAEGDFFVKVPWSDLTPHLDRNGPLKGLIKEDAS